MLQRRMLSYVLLSLSLCASAPAAAQDLAADAIKVIQSFQAGPSSPGASPISFVPPPRTIKDITAILDQQKPDPAKAAEMRQAADVEPPDGADRGELSHFYFRRGMAAGEVGRVIQRRDDLREAVRLGREAQLRMVATYLQQLAQAEVAAGNYRDAVARAVERSLAEPTKTPRAVAALLQVALNFAQLGNIDEAARWIARAENADFPTRDLNPIWTEFLRTIQVVLARAPILEIKGNLREAESAYRRSIEFLETRAIPNERALAYNTIGSYQMGTFANMRTNALQSLARVLARQGRLVEAESEARRALLDLLSRRGRYAPETAGSVLTLATVIFEQGRYPESEQLAQAALDIYENTGTDRKSATMSGARRQIAQAQAAQERWSESLQTYLALKLDIESDEVLATQFLTGNSNYAIALLRAGRIGEAEPIIRNVVATSEKNLGAKAYATAQARGWLGVTLTKAGKTAEASSQFQAALEILLAASREADDLDDDGVSVGQRDRQTQQIVESYLALLADTHGIAAAGEAFRLADAVRGKSVQRALAASAARGAASDPALAELARYEQDSQKQTAALQGLLANILTRPTSEQDPAATKKLREDIDKLRNARVRLRETIERRFPDYANLIDTKPATVEQAQESLRVGEALIVTYAGDERLFVWAVPAQGPASFAVSNVGSKALESMVAGLRKSLDPNASSIDEVPAFDVALANRLYELVLKPVEAGWADAKSLMVVPHKGLGQLPAALLVTSKVVQPGKAALPFAEYKSVPFLVRKAAVTQLPSVTALATLRSLPAPAANRETFIAFGDPWFSPEQENEAKLQVVQAGALQTRGIPLIRRNVPKTEGVDSADLSLLPRLPDTADEVKSIALALKADAAKDVFLGVQANEKLVKSTKLAARRIIMFATHGLVPGDLNCLTQPALALTAPKVAGIDGDRLLTMDEILALKLNADWVVLSACNTAAGSGAGAEAVSGLGRAFFYAGTRALLVSNWPVETGSARQLTTDLFRRQTENPSLARGEAMRQAMVALIDSSGALDDAKEPLFSYAHPIFWAPFSVVGDGG